MMAAALEMDEHHVSNLYGLFIVEASEKDAITGGAQHSDPLGFYWIIFSNLAVAFVAIVTVAWLIRHK